MTRQLLVGLVMGFALASGLLMVLTRNAPAPSAVHDAGSSAGANKRPSLIDRVQVLAPPPSAMLASDGGA